MTQDKGREGRPAGTTTGTSQRPPGVVSSPVLTFDLGRELEQLHSEDEWKRGERNTRTLVHEPSFRITLIALKAGGRLEEHSAPAQISIQVLHGQVSLTMPDQALALSSGQILALESDILHEIRAQEESAILLTIAWTGRSASEQGENA